MTTTTFHLPGAFARTLFSIVAALAFAATASRAQAQLTLFIDSATEQYWFSGTASGTPMSMMGSGMIAWESGGGNYSGRDVKTSFSGTAVTGSTQIWLWEPVNGGARSGVAIYSAASSSGVTLTADSNTKYSYAGYSTEFKSTYGAGNFTITQNTGTGFGALSVQQYVAPSAVPEPSTYAAILGGAALVGTWVMRRRRVGASSC